MNFIGFLILLVCFIPVWVPVLIALVGRREPLAVRIALGSAGVLAGVYAAIAFIRFEQSSGGGGSFSGFELLFIPFRSAILSFYLALTGVCLATAIHYATAGRLASTAGVAAGLLFAACLAAGVLFASWFFTLPHYD